MWLKVQIRQASLPLITHESPMNHPCITHVYVLRKYQGGQVCAGQQNRERLKG